MASSHRASHSARERSRRGRSAAAAIAALYGKRAPGGAALAAHEIDGVLLVAAWFQKHPEERARALTPEQARALCGAGAV